ncbi:hypothetical protein OAN12_06955 [Halioglobus sp.]|nr:hypothetical protein [Halioglobus sp.]
MKYIDPEKFLYLLGDVFPGGRRNALNMAKGLDSFLQCVNDDAAISMGGNQDVRFATPEDWQTLLKGGVDRLAEDNHGYQKAAYNRGEAASSLEGSFDITTRTVPVLPGKDRGMDDWYGSTTGFQSIASLQPPSRKGPTYYTVITELGSGDEWQLRMPLQFLIKGYPLRKSGSMGYAHGMCPDGRGEGPDHQQYVYLGITQRHWVKRFKEHMRGVEKGEKKKFYNTWRAFSGTPNVVYQSEVCIINATYQDVMDWEEEWVDRDMMAGKSLNMIPGGFKGIRELHKLGIKAGHTVDSYNRAIKILERRSPHAGIPNAALAKLWQDDDYAANMICNTNLGRLEIAQVQRIRELNYCEIPVEKITEMVGATNVEQVKRVLAGETYTRIQ